MDSRWTDDLRRRMAAHGTPPPAGLWDDIEHALDSRRRARRLWLPAVAPGVGGRAWRRAGAVAAAVAALLAVGGLLWMQADAPAARGVEAVADVPTSRLQPEASSAAAVPAGRASGSGVCADAWSSSPVAAAALCKQQGGGGAGQSAGYVADALGASPIEPLGVGTLVADADGRRLALAASQGLALPQAHRRVFGFASDYARPDARKRRRRWGAGLYALNAAQGSDSRRDGYMTFAAQAQRPQVYANAQAVDASEHSAIVLGNMYSEVYTDIEHSRPVVAGAMLTCALGPRLSLSAGLTYTRLSSDLRSGTDECYYSSRQRLGNVGLPVEVRVELWRRGAWSVYASAGGSADKNVSGSLVTDYFADGVRQSTWHESVSIDRLQWSVAASVGLQCDLASWVGIYAQPGFSHHFDNGTYVETVYRDRPTSFGLRFGLNFMPGR